jgi:hypothetical protein
VQGNTECETELSIQAKLLETKEVFANIFSEIAANELLTTIVESTSPILTSVVHGGSKELSVVRPHAIMHTRELGAQSLYVVLDVRLQCLEVNAVRVKGV